MGLGGWVHTCNQKLDQYSSVPNFRNWEPPEPVSLVRSFCLPLISCVYHVIHKDKAQISLVLLVGTRPRSAQTSPSASFVILKWKRWPDLLFFQGFPNAGYGFLVQPRSLPPRLLSVLPRPFIFLQNPVSVNPSSKPEVFAGETERTCRC